jgi:hypothetical protein
VAAQVVHSCDVPQAVEVDVSEEETIGEAHGLEDVEFACGPCDSAHSDCFEADVRASVENATPRLNKPRHVSEFPGFPGT